MTHLELVAKIGNDSLDVAKMYLKGQLTVGELTNILGKDRTRLIQQFAGDGPAANVSRGAEQAAQGVEA